MSGRATVRGRWTTRRLVAVVLALAVLPATAISLAGRDRRPAAASGAARPHWRSGPYCGVNAAYALLSLLGGDASYEHVRSQIRVSDAGSSITDIRDFLCGEGFEVTVVRANPSELVRTPAPFIAHFERDERQAYMPSGRGHFVVVISADRSAIRYIDGATAAIENRATQDFVRNWSGYLLVPQRNSYYGPILQTVGFSIVALLGIRVAWKRRRSRADAVVFVPSPR